MWSSQKQRPNTLSHDDFPALTSTAGGTNRTAPQGSGQTTPSMEQRFSLPGLVDIIKMTSDSEAFPLTLGYDLSTLGLNISSKEPYWFKTFACPWANTQVRVQPQFRIPQCFVSRPPPPVHPSMFQRFKPGTLFYIFYTMPHDKLQILAAQELYDRGWRFHKEMSRWIQVPEVPVERLTTGTFDIMAFDPDEWKLVRDLCLPMGDVRVYRRVCRVRACVGGFTVGCVGSSDVGGPEGVGVAWLSGLTVCRCVSLCVAQQMPLEKFTLVTEELEDRPPLVEASAPPGVAGGTPASGASQPLLQQTQYAHDASAPRPHPPPPPAPGGGSGATGRRGGRDSE
eukprot:TRINITY_DN1940_c0_g1_i2.p1 TRINITY_DN1940_c0_g1~~TRINITY_DN1940_c0_g1_i2.p1  ORF type:complete len:339 (+),score=35.80 TRINITY_DN1940_c0_g1_i2:240-1256(+)